MKALLDLIRLPFGILWLAFANLKLIPVSLMPLGKQIVPSNSSFVASYRRS